MRMSCRICLVLLFFGQIGAISLLRWVYPFPPDVPLTTNAPLPWISF